MDKQFQNKHNLSSVQTQALLLIFSSPTPQVALGSVKTNDKLAAATKLLIQLGLVHNGADGIEVTQDGIAMLDAINVVDKTGKRTPYGEEEFAKVVKLTSITSESVWPLINSVSQHV